MGIVRKYRTLVVSCLVLSIAIAMTIMFFNISSWASGQRGRALRNTGPIKTGSKIVTGTVAKRISQGTAQPSGKAVQSAKPSISGAKSNVKGNTEGSVTSTQRWSSQESTSRHIEGTRCPGIEYSVEGAKVCISKTKIPNTYEITVEVPENKTLSWFKHLSMAIGLGLDINLYSKVIDLYLHISVGDNAFLKHIYLTRINLTKPKAYGLDVDIL